MGGASSWYAMLAIAGFLFSVWFAGKASRVIGVSSIVMEVAVGLVLGPGVAKILPEELTVSFFDQTYECDEKFSKYQEKITSEGKFYCDLEAYVAAGKYDDYWGKVGSAKYSEYLGAHGGRRLAKSKEGKTEFDTYTACIVEGCKLDQALSTAAVPDIFTLTGHIGVGMMIFESGMHFDFEQAKTVGPWASLVAILGTFLPIIAGTALSMAFGFPLVDSLSAGVSLSPTSVGIALKLLHEANALSEYFGQAVMTAAFVDDVLALIIFSVLFTVGGGGATFMDFLPLILGCVFMALAIPAAVVVWPPFLNFVFRNIKEDKPDAKLTRHDEVMFVILFATLLAYGQITHVCGTHLWGCFIAGMSFATQHHAHHVWVRQVKRNTCWFLRIFFSCTLAWSIPVESLFSIEAFWKGTLMGIGPCIACKVFCGPFMGPSRWVIGWAMVGRAEFAYFIAIFAKSLKMMDEKLFAILIWSLLYATIFAPLIFRKVLARYMTKLGNHAAAERVSVTKIDSLQDGVHLDFEGEKIAEENRESRRKGSENEVLLAEAAEKIAKTKEVIAGMEDKLREKDMATQAKDEEISKLAKRKADLELVVKSKDLEEISIEVGSYPPGYPKLSPRGVEPCSAIEVLMIGPMKARL